MATRETTYDRIRMEAGELIPSAQMEMRLRAESGGDDRKLPVILQDSRGQWYWCGFRALLPPTLDTVSVKGRRWKVETMGKQLRGIGEVELAVAVDPHNPQEDVFRAPWPLVTVEHAERYFKAGVNNAHSDAEILNAMGWRNAGRFAIPALREAVRCVRLGRPMPDSTADFVKFPGEVEHVTRETSWADVAREIVGMRADVAAFRGDLADVAGKVEKLGRELGAISRRADGMAGKGEVARLRGELADVAGKVDSLAALV